MLPLVIFISLGIVILFLFEYRARRNSKKETDSTLPSQECCGQHLVCERDLKQNLGDEIVYFDDEELDELQGIAPGLYSQEQIESITSVFRTLRTDEILLWLHSLQLRNIELPSSLREEVLLTLSEDLKK